VTIFLLQSIKSSQVINFHSLRSIHASGGQPPAFDRFFVQPYDATVDQALDQAPGQAFGQAFDQVFMATVDRIPSRAF
jgi:hypothetical protein